MSCGQRLAAELRKQGYRVTPQRAVILETIAHLEEHSSVNEVFDLAKKRLPGLNLATVYRTVDKLQRAGLIDLLAASGEAMRFSLRDQSNKHGHDDGRHDVYWSLGTAVQRVDYISKIRPPQPLYSQAL